MHSGQPCCMESDDGGGFKYMHLPVTIAIKCHHKYTHTYALKLNTVHLGHFV